MKKETESRKTLKKELIRNFKKAFAKDFDALNVSTQDQWKVARAAVKQASAETKNGTDATLRRKFNNIKKLTRKQLDDIRTAVLVSAIGRSADQGRVDLSPRPQPPTVEIPSGKGPVWY